MPTAHVNIGSNIGDRHAHIERAVAAILSRLGGMATVRRSGFVESEPWGFDSDNIFVNLGVAFEWNGSAEELLELLLDAQNSVCGDSHRTADGGYADRVIDIDLIAFGSEIRDTPHLQLPHPRMTERMFVLKPLAELDPEWRHPHSGMSVSELIDRLSQSSALRKR